MLIASRQSFWSGGGISAKSYVQDGLVSMWDGIENAGFGTHDNSSSTWIDLGPCKNNLILPSSTLIWHDDCLEFDGKNCAYSNSFNWGGTSKNFTCECIYIIRQNGTAWNGMYGGRAPSINTIYGLNYWGGTNLLWNFGIGGERVDISVSNEESLRKLTEVDVKNNLIHCYDGSIKTLFGGLDGKITVSKTTSTSFSIPRIFMIGRAYNDNNFGESSSRSLKCDVFCLRIYNRVLSSEELLFNHEIDSNRFGV